MLEKMSRSRRSTAIRVPELCCPTEERLIRGKLEAINEKGEVSFNLLERVFTVVGASNSTSAILGALKSIGFAGTVVRAEASDHDDHGSHENGNHRWGWLAIAGVVAILAESVDWLGGPQWLEIALSLFAVAGAGLETFKKGWIAIKNRNLNINALMSVAVTGALLIGSWPEAAMVMVLFSLAETLEALSLDRARNAVKKLMAMAPDTGWVQIDGGSWIEIATKDITIGRIVRVRPGDRIVLDGIISKGNPSIDQSPVTGESIAVEKAPGDSVFAGTINQAGEFEFKVTAGASESTLSRIIHAVEAAQATKAPTQRIVDTFSKIYTPSIFALAIAVMLIPPLAFGQSWHDWIYKALVLLVVACPCALVISTPVTVVSGLAAAAKRGILIKGGVYLEQGRKLNTLALDKTGTLTQGKPKLTDWFALESSESDELRILGISLAVRSDHPVSRAIVQGGSSSSGAPEVLNFKALPGRGIQGEIVGRTLYLGNSRLAREIGADSPELRLKLETLEREGKTATILMEKGKALGVFAVADAIRKTSLEALAKLKNLGIKTIMLTGDNKTTAAAIARELGIIDVHAELLPEDKLRIVEKLLKNGAIVGMVGDGINDAPALAKASIGFAMGAAGSDTALETADVALMDDDLQKIPEFIQLSRRTNKVLTQNISIALTLKVIFLTLTVLGYTNMWMAVFADMGGSMIVVLNGLRMLKLRER